MKLFSTLLPGLALLAGAPVQAAACWDAQSVGAARIRELEIMLMNVSLRCASIGISLHGTLNQVRDTHKQVMADAHERLKAHYGISKAKIGGSEYDQFLTGLANFYGTGKTDPQSCRGFEAVMSELARPASGADMLAMVAMEMVRDPHLDGPRCTNAASMGQR